MAESPIGVPLLTIPLTSSISPLLLFRVRFEAALDSTLGVVIQTRDAGGSKLLNKKTNWSSSSCSTVIAEGEGTGISLYLDFTWLCKFFSSNICSQPCRHRTKRLSRNCRTKSEGTLRLSANTGLPQEHHPHTGYVCRMCTLGVGSLGPGLARLESNGRFGRKSTQDAVL